MLGKTSAARAARAPETVQPLSLAEPATAAATPALTVPQALLSIMQELSHARTLDDIIALIRNHARTLTAADGVSFVLKDGDQCHYVDENAVGPLWKGKRFPLSTCVSGWAMEHKVAVAIEDIYVDPRVPLDAYKVTFVKSLVMVPIRRNKPIGAIGFYWAKQRLAGEEEIAILQALADSVSVAMENVALYAELQSKVKQLQESNHELSRFACVASNDLQEPLRTITTQSEMLSRRYGDKLDERAQNYMRTVISSARRLQHLVEDLLVHARIEASENFKPVILEKILADVTEAMSMQILESGASVTWDDLPWLWCEEVMMSRLFQNLISNALKFRVPGRSPKVHITCRREEGSWHLTVTDNGIGIEQDQHEKIFGIFQRVHAQSVFPGAGIGLATCKKIVELHRGKLWVQSTLGEGAAFHLLLPLAGEAMPTGDAYGN